MANIARNRHSGRLRATAASTSLSGLADRRGAGAAVGHDERGHHRGGGQGDGGEDRRPAQRLGRELGRAEQRPERQRHAEEREHPEVSADGPPAREPSPLAVVVGELGHPRRVRHLGHRPADVGEQEPAEERERRDVARRHVEEPAGDHPEQRAGDEPRLARSVPRPVAVREVSARQSRTISKSNRVEILSYFIEPLTRSAPTNRPANVPDPSPKYTKKSTRPSASTVSDALPYAMSR